MTEPSYREALSKALIERHLDDVKPGDRKAVAAEIAHRVHLDSNGRPIVAVETIKADLLQAEPWWLRLDEPAAPPVAPSAPRTALASAMAAAKQRKAAENKAEIDKIASGKNPWAQGSLNLTRQSILINRAPAIAEKLRAAAGHG